MRSQKQLQPKLRQQANAVLQRLSPPEREVLLIKCWMSHDARWFMAVAREYGTEAANRLNQVAAHEVGKVEARRIARALELPAAITIDDWLLTQEIFFGLVGPGLADYRVMKAGSNAFEVDVQRCFANENATRAGVADQMECGVFARITGWADALGLRYEITPPSGKCLMAQGRECGYTFRLTAPPESVGLSGEKRT